jgi:hypothetical protein
VLTMSGLTSPFETSPVFGEQLHVTASGPGTQRVSNSSHGFSHCLGLVMATRQSTLLRT